MRCPERQTSSPLSYPEESQNRLELRLGMIMKLGNRTDLEECFQRRTEIKRQSNYPMVVVVGTCRSRDAKHARLLSGSHIRVCGVGSLERHDQFTQEH